jgi:hypothetical protein
VQVPYDEGVANRIDPRVMRSCPARRRRVDSTAGSALVMAYLTGQLPGRQSASGLNCKPLSALAAPIPSTDCPCSGRPSPKRALEV